MEPQRCGILFSHPLIEDECGCLRIFGHDGEHVFLIPEKEHKFGPGMEPEQYVSWEDDYSCTCGCKEEAERENSNDVCQVYTIMTKNQGVNLLRAYAIGNEDMIHLIHKLQIGGKPKRS